GVVPGAGLELVGRLEADLHLLSEGIGSRFGQVPMRRQGDRLGPARAGFPCAEPESDPVGALRSVSGTDRSRPAVDLGTKLGGSVTGVRGHPEVGIGTGQADGAGAGRRQAAGRAGVVGRAAALRRAGFVPATCGRLVGPVPTRTFAPTGVASLAG